MQATVRQAVWVWQGSADAGNAQLYCSNCCQRTALRHQLVCPVQVPLQLCPSLGCASAAPGCQSLHLYLLLCVGQLQSKLLKGQQPCCKMLKCQGEPPCGKCITSASYDGCHCQDSCNRGRSADHPNFQTAVCRNAQLRSRNWAP